ncbi:MAG TPA: CapA family protein [Xanthobacteraceae bacterium]|nr:CapA family protein [Xanthobacteraceae bacterium]
MSADEARRADGPACTLVFGGDVAPVRPAHDDLFGELAPFLRAAEVALCNLEIALSDKGRPARGKSITARGAPAAVDALVEAGFDAVNLANNHVLDYGEEALCDTLARLDAAGLPHFGAGCDAAAAAAPIVLERNRLRIGLLGYTSTLPQGFAATETAPGVNPLRAGTAYRPARNPEEYPGSAPTVHTWAEPKDLARMVDDIRALKAKTDVVLVYQHWGASMTEAVLDFQREIGHAAIEAGAAGVFGGHQHVVSGIEFHKGCPIVHGMGNLLFDVFAPFLTAVTHRTFLFKARLSPAGLSACEILPCRAGVTGRYDRPAFLPPEHGDGARIVETVHRLSEPFGTRLTATGGRVAVEPA